MLPSNAILLSGFKGKILFFLFFSSLVFCESFPQSSTPKTSIASGRKLWGMGATTEEVQASSATCNWRVIPKQSDDYKQQLQDRPTWSASQFQESLELYDRLTSCTDSYVNGEIRNALNSLDHAYRLYGPESVICSFNGGKDAVVILHLVRAAHAKYYNETGKTPIVRPRVVYFDHKNEFPELVEFLRDSVARYDLDMLAFEQGVKFQDGLKIVVNHNFLPGSTRSYPMAFVLGTRSSDPNAMGQEHFAPSSHWMPPFMRVNPVLQWNYGHIWHFLRLFQLPYCSLYDQGYTSLGTVKDTLPCPALAVIRESTSTDLDDPDGGNSTALPKFWPAYMLRDWDQERAGRISKQKGDKPAAPKSSTAGASTSSNASVITKTLSQVSITSHFRNQGDKLASSEADTQEHASVSTLNNCVEKTVGILIIGDEILKGLTLDQNTNVAAKALRKECVKLARVVVVSDNPDEIGKEVERLQSEVDVIITSGGVGPTHDDVTIRSVAAALGVDMALHGEMVGLLKEKMGSGDSDTLTPAQIKMATLPSNAKLRYLSGGQDDWPVLQCKNVFILPGVPEFFSQKIKNVAAYLSTQLERSAAFKIVLSVDEASIVDTLNDAVLKHPNVTFGSYPFVSHPEFKTVLTLEGSLVDVDNDSFVDKEASFSSMTSRNSRFFDALALSGGLIPKDTRDRYVRRALDYLITKLPKDSILRVENDDLTPFT